MDWPCHYLGVLENKHTHLLLATMPQYIFKRKGSKDWRHDNIATTSSTVNTEYVEKSKKTGALRDFKRERLDRFFLQVGTPGRK